MIYIPNTKKEDLKMSELLEFWQRYLLFLPYKFRLKLCSYI